MTTKEEFGTMDPTIPQWKRDLIIRRRAVGRVLSTGSGSVQLTCPSVVDAVRLAEYSVNSNFHRSCEIERELTGVSKNMRLIEQVNASDDFVEPCVVPGIKEIITKIESGRSKGFKMGEEKNDRKKFTSSFISDKKAGKLSDADDDCISDSSEEFKYGPGIVSKLKSKYLSLTLRESQGKVRPSLDSLRRASSLENVLNSSESERAGDYKLNYLKKIQQVGNGMPVQRCRGLTRSSRDSMKRARSVEVLTRYDRVNIVNNRRSLDAYVKDESSDNDDRGNSRNRISRLNVEEKELPPPDLVKQTLQLFEKSQNVKSNLPVKIKNQTRLECAKKPVICPKSCAAMLNGVDKVDCKPSEKLKLTTECRNHNFVDYSKNKFLNDNTTLQKNVAQTTSTNTAEVDLIGNVSRRKAALLNKNACDYVGTKFLSSIGSPKSTLQDGNSEKNISSSQPMKNGLSLDLADLATNVVAKQEASHTNASCRVKSESEIEIVEAECVSPVLVRAPPSILSTELSPGNLPSPQAKQVGVIRPIVTNKIVQSNLTKHQLNKSHLTDREIEKNLINKVKCIEQSVTKVIVSLKKSPEECFVSETGKLKETSTSRQFWDKKSNTVVFNFSNRKTVPDYVENDGLILARREKPKLGEPGIVILNRESEQSSTDFDPEEFISEPPLPCDIVFEGDNVLINGKSNIQTKPKEKKSHKDL
ncbi:hypothetical protein RUM44_013135 [Polyplax serrata]|uniref:Uncharacterized protein n=1 Tax=Polyplax serrata TaxID=468196 RepID=A0ABR1BH94_POLSC